MWKVPGGTGLVDKRPDRTSSNTDADHEHWIDTTLLLLHYVQHSTLKTPYLRFGMIAHAMSLLWLASLIAGGGGWVGGIRGAMAFSTRSIGTTTTTTTSSLISSRTAGSRRALGTTPTYHLPPHRQVNNNNNNIRLFSATTSGSATSSSTVGGNDDDGGGGGDLDDLNAMIKAKGDEIRQLKADGIDKEALSPHVEELLALKAQLPSTQQDASAAKKPESKQQKAPKQGKKSNNNQNNNKKKGGGDNGVPMTESEIKLNRLAKVNTMREANVEPFEYTYGVTTSTAQLAADYDGKLEPGEEDEGSDVAVAGRIMTRRVFGKLAFFTLQDECGIIQLQFDKKRLGDSFRGIKEWTDGGDIIGVRGTVRRTDKGELTVYAKEWQMLTKAFLPLPDKFHGLQDITKRYRSRHVDLIVNPTVRDTFRKRAQITSMLRRLLDDMGFLEIETPVLHSQSGGAEAKPFETFHNSMDMDLTLRIATELHLKRLVIGGFEKVYEVGRIFRNEGISTRHNPEFTSVELYQAYADYDDMMDLTESLVCCK